MTQADRDRLVGSPHPLGHLVCGLCGYTPTRPRSNARRRESVCLLKAADMAVAIYRSVGTSSMVLTHRIRKQ